MISCHPKDGLLLIAACGEMVAPLSIEKVAENILDHWHEIVIYLGVSLAVLTECEYSCTH